MRPQNNKSPITLENILSNIPTKHLYNNDCLVTLVSSEKLPVRKRLNLFTVQLQMPLCIAAAPCQLGGVASTRLSMLNNARDQSVLLPRGGVRPHPVTVRTLRLRYDNRAS